MSYEVTIRFARQEDLKHRMELVRQGFSAHFWDAFWFFLLQELTLECCVLGAAVLFIFCGVSVVGCLLLLPLSAMVVAMTVLVTHQAMAQKHTQNVRNELFGVVAEVRKALVLSPDRTRPVYIQYQLTPDINGSTEYGQLVGTVSVSEFWGPQANGWLHSLAVHSEWRRRGVGRALVGGAQTAGGARRLSALVAACSALQPAARSALHAAGWECTGSYCRPLLGASLSLPLVRLMLDLPPV